VIEASANSWTCLRVTQMDASFYAWDGHDVTLVSDAVTRTVDID